MELNPPSDSFYRGRSTGRKVKSMKGKNAFESFQHYNWGHGGGRREQYDTVYRSPYDFVFKDESGTMRGDFKLRVAEFKGKAYLQLIRSQTFLPITEKEFEDLVSDQMINNIRKEFQAANRAIVTEFGADFAVNDVPDQILVPTSERSKVMLKRKRLQKQVLKKLKKREEERAAQLNDLTSATTSGSETEDEGKKQQQAENLQLKEKAAASFSINK